MLHRDAIAILSGFHSRCSAGYAVGLHLQYTTSKYIFQHYSRSWMQEYSRRGFILTDPTVKWGIANEGWIRWSDLSSSDDGYVLRAAADFGLKFGVTISIVDSSARSLGSFASTEDEFGDETISDLAAGLGALHAHARSIDLGSEEDHGLKNFASTLGHW
jgi:LuxR family transcriptional regulator, quorum-sensing system regulator SdiA